MATCYWRILHIVPSPLVGFLCPFLQLHPQSSEQSLSGLPAGLPSLTHFTPHSTHPLCTLQPQLVSIKSNSDHVTSAHNCSLEPSAARVKTKLFGLWAQSNFSASYSSNVLQVPHASTSQTSLFFQTLSAHVHLQVLTPLVPSAWLSVPPRPLA